MKEQKLKSVDIEKQLKYYEKLPYHIMLEPWDDGDGLYWVARVVELPHCLIHGDTKEEAIQEIEEVKRDWIKSNLMRGIKIPEPVSHNFSGQIRVRMSPSLHLNLWERANIENVSMNHLIVSAIESSVCGNFTDKHMKKRPVKKTGNKQ